MSGICGILRFDGQPVRGEEVGAQLRMLAHRGPDRRAEWHEGPIGLGHLLMRVTPEDACDAQPLHDSAGGLVLCADVRLDNRDELAALLGLDKTALREMPDSALLLQAWRRWGSDSISRLIGDFAFALWDQRNRCLTLARDHMGQRQLFYYVDSKFVAFATEVKGLWAVPGVPRVISETQIARLLALQYWGPRDGSTYWKDIRGLQGGRMLTIEASGSVNLRRYWEPHPAPSWENRKEADYIEGYRGVLGEAVRCRLRSIGGVGLMLSGGFDSAAIAALAARELALSGKKLTAVSSVMPENYRGSIRHCRRWVEMCRRQMPNLDVHYVTRAGRSPLDDIEHSVGVKDGPAGNYDYVTGEMLETIAGRGVRVAMDGHGGDYTINPRGNFFLAGLLRKGALLRFVSEYRAHRRATNDPRWRILTREVIKPLLPVVVGRAVRRLQASSSPWRDLPIADEFAQRLTASGELDVDAVSSNHWKLPPSSREMVIRAALMVSDGASVALCNDAASRQMELTRPFHDRRVVEFGLAVPEDLYVRDGWNRYLARTAMKDLYPPDFATRWRRNDDEAPDFHRCVKGVEGVIGLQLDRMASDDVVRRYVDLERIRNFLAERGVEDHNSGWEQETQLAVMGLLMARFVEWFKDDVEPRPAASMARKYQAR